MTTEQRRFVDAYLETRSAKLAMMKLYPDMDPKAAGIRGHRHLSNECVRAEIGHAEQAARVVSTLTAMERREWIADLVRVDPRKALTTSPHLVQSVDVTRRILETGEVEERVKIKMPDKLRAIEVDAKLDTLANATDDETSLLLDGLAELMGVTAPALPAPADTPTLDTDITEEDAV